MGKYKRPMRNHTKVVRRKGRQGKANRAHMKKNRFANVSALLIDSPARSEPRSPAVPYKKKKRVAPAVGCNQEDTGYGTKGRTSPKVKKSKKRLLLELAGNRLLHEHALGRVCAPFLSICSLGWDMQCKGQTPFLFTFLYSFPWLPWPLSPVFAMRLKPCRCERESRKEGVVLFSISAPGLV